MLKMVAFSLLRNDSTWRAIALVVLILVAAFAITGAVSSAYTRERIALGEKHFRSGEALARTGQTDDAIEEYRRALLFLPDQSQFRLSLAVTLLDAGRLNEAESHLQQLAEEEPTNPLIYLALARIASRRNQVNRAIQQYQRCVYEYWPPALVPMRRAARWELVQLLSSQGKTNEAVAELMQLYASAPEDPGERERVGFLLVKYGASSEANQIFRDLVRQHPQDEAAHRGLAQLALGNGDFVAARHEFQRALRYDPKDLQSVTGLATTDAVIEMNAAMPGISESERLRRSQTLVRRVLADLATCTTDNSSVSDEFETQLEAARDLLTAKHKPGEDVVLELQVAAQRLWQQRSGICGKNVTPDVAVNLVLSRVAGE